MKRIPTFSHPGVLWCWKIVHYSQQACTSAFTTLAGSCKLQKIGPSSGYNLTLLWVAGAERSLWRFQWLSNLRLMHLCARKVSVLTCSPNWCLCSTTVFSSSEILVCCCCTTLRKCLMHLWLGISSLGISSLQEEEEMEQREEERKEGRRKEGRKEGKKERKKKETK